MKRLDVGQVLSVAAVLMLTMPGQSQQNRLTPAEQKILWAEAGVKAAPDHAQPYNELAVADVLRARETGDASYYDQADAALKTSFAIANDNLEGGKARTMVLLGRHEYPEALDLARKLNKLTPDDVLVYGLVADAAIELGNYDEAERSTQWMLDLRPGNVPGLLRAARLRQFFGDSDGSLDFYSQAYQQIPPTQTEEAALILNRMADVQLSTGHLKEAASLLHSASEKFPGYYLTLESLARVESAQQNYTAAVDLLRRRNQCCPTASSEYALAEALRLAGAQAEANAAYGESEALARSQVNAPENANRELVFYYLGRGNKPAEALSIATAEAGRRHDAYTLDAYAWALAANGKNRAAKQQMDAALAVGIRDAEIFYHAGLIAGNLQDQVASMHYLRESLEVNPSSEVSTDAHHALDKMNSPTVAALGGK